MGAFEGKVAIVTGGSSGIGAAAALRLAREGAKVVIAARRSDKSEAVVRQIEAFGGEALFIRTDVTKRADIEALVASTLAAFGRLDCAVNNAGIVGPALTPVAEIEEDRWDEVMNINLKGVWRCMKYEIPAMLKQGKGAIVNIFHLRIQTQRLGSRALLHEQVRRDRSFEDRRDRLCAAGHPG